MIEKNCLQCNKTFKTRLNWVKKGYGKYCSLSCHGLSTRGRTAWNKGGTSWMKGLKWSEEAKRKNSEAHKGVKSYLWKGGVSSLNKIIRASLDYKLWRTAVFERDNYTCRECGERGKQGHRIRLNSHHIESFALYPNLRFKLSNGLTLCVACHKETSNYLNRWELKKN